MDDVTLTLSVNDDCSFMLLMEEMVGVSDMLLPNIGDRGTFRFRDGVLLNENARPT
jgi:hypothetical protein